MTRIETNPKESFVGFQPTRKKMEPTLISFPRQTLERIFSFFLGNSKSMRVWFFKKRKKIRSLTSRSFFVRFLSFFPPPEVPKHLSTSKRHQHFSEELFAEFRILRGFGKRDFFGVRDYSAEASFYSDNTRLSDQVVWDVCLKPGSHEGRRLRSLFALGCRDKTVIHVYKAPGLDRHIGDWIWFADPQLQVAWSTSSSTLQKQSHKENRPEEE